MLGITVDLGVRASPLATPAPPSDEWIACAFDSLGRLLGSGPVEIGEIRYQDAGPPGRLAPVEFHPVDLADGRRRVAQACATASRDTDWAFACWIANTPRGDAVAEEALRRRS